MYQVLVQEYGNDTPKGISYRTTDEVEDFLHTLEMKSLVYLEVRYVRSFRLSAKAVKIIPREKTG